MTDRQIEMLKQFLNLMADDNIDVREALYDLGYGEREIEVLIDICD